MIDLDTMPPDWAFAQNHAKASKPGIVNGLHTKMGKSVFCQCCLKPVEKENVPLFANSKQLQFLGFGFPLYFIYLKYSIVLILILICSYSGVALYWAIESNIGFCTSHRLLSGGGSTNQHCTSFLIIFARIEDHISGEEIILRIASFIIHLAALIYIRDNIRKTVEYYDEKTTSLSDYSFVMKNLPLKTGIQQNIRDFVDKFFFQNWKQLEDTYQSEHFQTSAEKVMQITLIPGLNDYFNLEEEKHHFIEEKRKLLINEEKYFVSAKIAQENSNTVLEVVRETIDTQIKEIKCKIQNFRLQFKERVENDELPAEFAIITMNTELHKNIILDFAKENKLKKELVGEFFGEFEGEIKILQAPEPNEIIWENMHYSTRDRFIGKIIGWTLTIIFIAICTVGFYFILVAKTNSLLHAMEEFSTQDEMKHSSSYRFSVFLVFLLIFLIVLFNKLVMSWVLHQFTHLQKHEHTSDEQFSFALKYTIGLFFTTALMTLAVEDITYHNFFAHEYGVIEEESIMFFVNALFIPIFMLVNPHQLKNRLMRFFRKDKKYFTQGEANKIMSDNPYTMGKEYAEIVETLWFTFLYATMIPMGAFITIIGITLYYWVDKYNLLRRSSLSHNISGEMALVSLKLLDFTLIMKPAGELIFDSGIRGHIQIESIVLIGIALVYILLPMNSILEFFHDEEFAQEEKTYDDVRHVFLQTYQTLHPVMNYEIEKIFKNLQKSSSKQICLTGVYNILNQNMMTNHLMTNMMTNNNEIELTKNLVNPATKDTTESLKKLLEQIDSPPKMPPVKVIRDNAKQRKTPNSNNNSKIEMDQNDF